MKCNLTDWVLGTAVISVVLIGLASIILFFRKYSELLNQVD